MDTCRRVLGQLKNVVENSAPGYQVSFFLFFGSIVLCYALLMAYTIQ